MRFNVVNLMPHVHHMHQCNVRSDQSGSVNWKGCLYSLHAEGYKWNGLKRIFIS